MAPIGHLVGKVSFQGPIFKVNMERNSSPSSLNAFIWSREVLRLLRVSESPGGLLKLEVAAPHPHLPMPSFSFRGSGFWSENWRFEQVPTCCECFQEHWPSQIPSLLTLRVRGTHLWSSSCICCLDILAPSRMSLQPTESKDFVYWPSIFFRFWPFQICTPELSGLLSVLFTIHEKFLFYSVRSWRFWNDSD